MVDVWWFMISEKADHKVSGSKGSKQSLALLVLTALEALLYQKRILFGGIWVLESTMGYWSQFDEVCPYSCFPVLLCLLLCCHPVIFRILIWYQDSTRLPAGFKRIGYDADNATYTYEDSDGNRYEGAPSCEYGVLTKSKNCPYYFPYLLHYFHESSLSKVLANSIHCSTVESSSPARQFYRSSRSNTPHSSFSRGSTFQDFLERSPAEKPHAEKSPVPPPAGAPSFGESKENYQSTWSLLSIARLLACLIISGMFWHV